MRCTTGNGQAASGLYRINIFRRLSSCGYMPFEGQPIHLTDAQRNDRDKITGSRALPAEFVQRAKVVLLLADGVSARTVAT